MRFFAVLCALLLTAMTGMAFEFDKISDALSRERSDELFSKDYRYEVLGDLSVRRIWTEDNRQISLDYQTAGDQLICAELRYKTPVATAIAIRDAESIAKLKLPVSKWKQAKKESAEEIGLSTCRYVVLPNGNYLFIEIADKGKAGTLCFFSKRPRINRRELGPASMVLNTGFGANPDAETAQILMEDEKERQTQTSAGISLASNRDDGRKPQYTTPPQLVKKTTEGREGTGKSVSSPSWYEGIGMTAWGGIAFVLFLAFILISRAMSSKSQTDQMLEDRRRRDQLIQEQAAKIAACKQEEEK